MRKRTLLSVVGMIAFTFLLSACGNSNTAGDGINSMQSSAGGNPGAKAEPIALTIRHTQVGGHT